MKLSVKTKIVLAMATVGLLVVGSILTVSYQYRHHQLVHEFQVYVRCVAGTTSLAISSDDLARIHTNADVSSPAFQRVLSVLKRASRITGVPSSQLYILRPVDIAQYKTEFVAMQHPKPFVGDPYTIPPANRAKFIEGWNSRSPVNTEFYNDENGRWISCYAPVLNTTGEPVAMVEADVEISRFLMHERQELCQALVTGMAAFAIAMIPGLLLAGQITRGLKRLTTGIQQFKNGDYSVQLPSHETRDEVGQLSAVFNDMIVAMAERLNLLPYVSRFTAEAVRKSRHDPSWLSGSEHDVVMLFADIRGFTRYSETREASMLVTELNRLLAVQADSVISAGGDVDKFIGDAVMAVFLDEDGTAETALRCACELIHRVKEETISLDKTLALGIGIHRGRAVVGSIGSEARRDFTAIGHTVNLAARLCDRASAWEILISDEVYQQLPAELQCQFLQTEPMQFKNVQQFVATYRRQHTDFEHNATVAETSI